MSGSLQKEPSGQEVRSKRTVCAEWEWRSARGVQKKEAPDERRKVSRWLVGLTVSSMRQAAECGKSSREGPESTAGFSTVRLRFERGRFEAPGCGQRGRSVSGQKNGSSEELDRRRQWLLGVSCGSGGRRHSSRVWRRSCVSSERRETFGEV